MPRRTTTPADEGIRAAMEERVSAEREQSAAAELADTAPLPMKLDVRITSARDNPGDPIRAFATLTVNNVLDIKGLRVMEGEHGMFVSMPARRLQSGEYSPVCRAVTPEFKTLLNDIVLGAYQIHQMEQAQERQSQRVAEPEQEQEQADPELQQAPAELEPEMGM